MGKIHFGTQLDLDDPFQKEFYALFSNSKRKGNTLLGIMAHELMCQYHIDEIEIPNKLPYILNCYEILKDIEQGNGTGTDMQYIEKLFSISNFSKEKMLEILAQEFFYSMGLSLDSSMEDIENTIRYYQAVKAAQRSLLSRIPASAYCITHTPGREKEYPERKLDKVEKTNAKELAPKSGPTLKDLSAAFPML